MKLAILPAILISILIGQGCASSSPATYISPDAAVGSLVSAVRTNDDAKVEAILGPQSGDLLHSGDEVADRQGKERFLASFEVKHRFVTNDDGSVTLTIGESDWPLPIPLVKDAKSGKWIFDTEAGRQEIIDRRIGRNELDVIQVCQAIVDAQREYAERDPDNDGVPAYARQFISDPGKKNGLYWKTGPGEPESPLGPQIAEAALQGYQFDPSHAKPYHGYYYRILTSQGPHASGGALDYIINGQLIGGFAVIAWPAEYGNSGIMTFIVNHEEIVYQKDLGNDTDKLAKALVSFDPGPDWKKTQ